MAFAPAPSVCEWRSAWYRIARRVIPLPELGEVNACTTAFDRYLFEERASRDLGTMPAMRPTVMPRA